MANINGRREAINLRLLGFTYTEIKNKLGIPKSTLSYWLGKYPLTKEQFTNLKNNIKKRKFLAIEKTSQTKRLKREKLRDLIYHQELKLLFPLNIKALYLAGLMLYWGEGTKNWGSAVSLDNTDPRVVKFFLKWLTQTLFVSKNRIKVTLQLYKDMNIQEKIYYWSKELDIPVSQFIKPYIKNSISTTVDHSGYKNGTCGLYVYDVKLKTKIMSAINVIADRTFL